MHFQVSTVMASNCAEHVSKRKRVSRMELENVEYLNKTVTHYSNSASRSSCCCCLASTYSIKECSVDLTSAV